MSVRKITDKKWQVDYYPQGRKGKRVRVAFQGSEAEARSLELELRRQNTSLISVINPKIMDVIPEFLEWAKVHRAQRTWEDYEKTLKYLMPVFGKLPVSRITPTIITQYQKKRGNTPRACIKELDYLKTIIRWMVDNNYASPLPFKIKHIKYRAPMPTIPHPLEIDKFMAEINDPMKRAFVMFMWMCGLRFEDARHIRWENINWTSGTVLLTETKGDEPRMCVLPDAIRELIEPHKKDKGVVFENPKTNKPFGSMKNLFKGACRRAGIARFSPHKLRHAFGTYALEATDNLRLVQELMGHKNISSTTIYTQIAMQRKKEALIQTQKYMKGLKNQ